MHQAAASRLATALAAEDTSWAQLEGTAVLADLSGFTRLTEMMASRGPEGAELLHHSLTTCFGALLGSSLDLGGDVLGFAGDAALVWFDSREHPDHAERAARAAATMPGNLAAVPASMTAGTRLRLSVGLHTGRYLAVGLDIGERHGVALCGPTMSALARLEHAALPGQVLASDRTVALLPAPWAGARSTAGVLLDRRRVQRAVATTPTDRLADDEAAQRGEHRVASIGFVKVPGLDELFAAAGPDGVAARVHHVAEEVSLACAANAVTVVDTDVGVDGVTFVLAAGAPRTVDDDDVRLLLALRRILDDTSVPLRAGAQRGHVFSGVLGARERRTHTVLGDAVNVAARALGRADDGDLVIADGLAAGVGRWTTADADGPQRLKNRKEPMPMWRVHAVAPLPRRRPHAGDTTVEVFRRSEWDQLVAIWKERTTP